MMSAPAAPQRVITVAAAPPEAAVSDNGARQLCRRSAPVMPQEGADIAPRALLSGPG